MLNQEDNLFGQLIYSYTRAEALEDGELIDVSKMAKEAGFKIPVAVTRAVWGKYIKWTDEDTDKQTHQDESGRLWDILWMLSLAARRGRHQGQVYYKLHVIPRNGRSLKARLTQLKATIHGGDQGEPVITIMLPEED